MHPWARLAKKEHVDFHNLSSKSANSDFPFTLYVLARHYTTGGTRPPFFPLRWIRSITSKSTSRRTREDDVRSVTPYRRSMERSFFPGDVSAPRWTEDKLCCLFFVCSRKHKRNTNTKGNERCWFCGVVGRAPSAAIDAIDAMCLFRLSVVKKKCLVGFSEFLFHFSRLKTL